VAGGRAQAIGESIADILAQVSDIPGTCPDFPTALPFSRPRLARFRLGNEESQPNRNWCLDAYNTLNHAGNARPRIGHVGVRGRQIHRQHAAMAGRSVAPR
jgi:hypothetical protein